MRNRLLIATTVHETLAVILRDQPRFLNQHFHVELVTSPSPDLSKLEIEGVQLHSVPMRRGISPFNDFISLFLMMRLMLNLKPDIVHSYTPKAGFVCMLAAWVCRVPVRIHTFTGLIWPSSIGIRKSLLMLADRLLCVCATHILPEGEGVLRDLRFGRITDKPLRVIGYGNIAGVDVEYFSPFKPEMFDAGDKVRQHYDVDSRDFVFVFVGRLNRDKGIEELLNAFEKLPSHCQLLIVGGLDETVPINAHLEQTIKNHPRIHWMGFLDDIRPALMAANVLVLPSYREGFPNVVIQAGAMQLPVIATDISGSNEVIQSGFNGWLVPVKDSEALSHAMGFAVTCSPSILTEMGRAARVRVVERFERTAHWQRMLAFYSSLAMTLK